MVATARLSVAEHVCALREAGRRLADAAAAAGLDAAVPACEGWTVRDLTGHIGGVHRWATSIVAGARSEATSNDEDEVFFTAPGEGVIDWFEGGVVALIEALEAADPSLDCWTFFEAPSPLAFWARRQ
ncbi:MAG TPA: maleylpyruvate isomerase N-terminal domain-containing protein, partial [Acidimicrobiales bacterium]|nr:maleylpyruvate isomerase N-terminal domain-containing protein [Acidimicrobiales bacterium]